MAWSKDLTSEIKFDKRQASLEKIRWKLLR
jgi:hypothetical protein